MSVNGASTIVGHVSWVIWGWEASNIVINKVLAAFLQKKQTKRFLLHLENERQKSVRDFGSCIIGNMSGA
jgi:hypothetical protein